LNCHFAVRLTVTSQQIKIEPRFLLEERNEETQSSAGVGNIADSFCSDRPVGRSAEQPVNSSCTFGELSLDTRCHDRGPNYGANRISAALCTSFCWSL